MIKNLFSKIRKRTWKKKLIRVIAALGFMSERRVVCSVLCGESIKSRYSMQSAHYSVCVHGVWAWPAHDRTNSRARAVTAGPMRIRIDPPRHSPTNIRVSGYVASRTCRRFHSDLLLIDSFGSSMSQVCFLCVRHVLQFTIAQMLIVIV